MAFRVNVAWTNKRPDTIWNRLATKLGREPTSAEATAEVRRILEESLVERASKGKLRFQRGRR